MIEFIYLNPTLNFDLFTHLQLFLIYFVCREVSYFFNASSPQLVVPLLNTVDNPSLNIFLIFKLISIKIRSRIVTKYFYSTQDSFTES